MSVLFLAWLLASGRQVPAADAGSLIRRKNGDTLEVVAITDSSKKLSWSVKGKLIKLVEPSTVIAVNGDHGGMPNPANILTVVFALNRRVDGDIPDCAFKIPGSETVATPLYVSIEDHPAPPSAQRVSVGIECPFGGAKSTDLTIGFAESDWKTIGAYSYRKGKAVSHTGRDFSPMLRPAKTQAPSPALPGAQHRLETGFNVSVGIPKDLSGIDVRVIAVDSNGNEFRLAGSDSPTELSLTDNYAFEGQASEVARVQLQVRPYEWTTFRHIPLRPAQ